MPDEQESVKIGFDEYIKTTAKELLIPEQRTYEQNLILITRAVNDSPFLHGLSALLDEIATKYSPARPALLFGEPPRVSILQKPYASAINKTYRHNVVFNKLFPKPPTDGWMDGTTIYSKVNDIVRSTIVCKYIDGPEYVCQALTNYCKDIGSDARYYPMNTDRGYYAWHFYTDIAADVFISGEVAPAKVSFELQVTTQLADVLTALTHSVYRGERALPGGRRDDDWKWAPSTEKFRAAYMGHTLHLLEGVILGLKNEVLGEDDTKEASK